MDYIEKKGQTENTLFVYVCDNGWVQNENDGAYNPISKQSPYDYGLRTPIMYKWKGKITPKLDTLSLTSSLDMVPTVLALLGMDRPEELDGINVLDETEIKNREAVYGEIYNHDFNTIEDGLKYRMVMTNPYKLIVPDPKNRPNEKIQLYDIFKDPFEKVDLAGERPKVVDDLMKKIETSWSTKP